MMREILLLATCLAMVEQACGLESSIIIVEDARVCFRRALAGSRVSRTLVRRTVLCSSVQECQRACQEEKRFACESFNYRVPLAEHRKSDCELIELPITHLDRVHDIRSDRDYDVYEKDRNAYPNCDPSRRQDAGYLHRYPDRIYRESERRSGRADGGSGALLNYNPNPQTYLHYRHQHYLPAMATSDTRYYGKPPIYPSPWDPNPPRRSYLPEFREGHSLIEKPSRPRYGVIVPVRIPSHHLSTPKEIPSDYDYDLPSRAWIWENDFPSTDPNAIEHKHATFDLTKECSSRVATGFKLHKLAVDKQYSVSDIYECEQVCLLEDAFTCSTYAYRYSKTSEPTENCLVSHIRLKQLNFYTDLEPQRDFDIYSMQNLNVCMGRQSQQSDCFWHLRSGHTFDPDVVREASKVQNIVECQLACLRATKYVCRGFSFKHGRHPPNGEDNCFLTDWPASEINPRRHYTQKSECEIYERGSFGHGCELNHFAIHASRGPEVVGSSTDQLCYVGYGTPARLLPAAIEKSLYASSEFDCKSECSRHRYANGLPCMSFSFRTNAPRGSPNCYLSEIQQQDLLNMVDYKTDPNSWLFAWDVYNPKCVALHRNTYLPNAVANHPYIEEGPKLALDSWRYYTVSGWPCRYGTTCEENKEVGFWFCHLEGGPRDSWDYCCRPDHECGYSEGYNYQWCYVGPRRTQWRKCNEHYYPYSGQRERRIDSNYQTPIGIETQEPGYRPRLYPQHPSLNAYEKAFNTQFLQEPPTGFFGQPRLWPVSYLHHELPSEENATEYQHDAMKLGRIKAIHNLIMLIKSNTTNDIEYSNNQTNLLIKIPLPGNLTAYKANEVEKTDRSTSMSLGKLVQSAEDKRSNKTINSNEETANSQFKT